MKIFRFLRPPSTRAGMKSGTALQKRAYRVPRDKTSIGAAVGSGGHERVPRALYVLRARARDLAHNNPYSARAITTLADNSIGSGVLAAINGDDEFEAYVKAWCESPFSDFEGKHNYYTQQHIAARTMFEAGECFQIVRYVRDGGQVVPKVQLIDPDLLADGASAKSPGNKCVSGVEIDGDGIVVGYHFRKSGSSFESYFVDADHVMHFFEPVYAGQMRGIPCGVQAIVSSGNVDALLMRAIQRAKIEASQVVFLTAEAGAIDEGLPEIGAAIDQDGNIIDAAGDDEVEYNIPTEIESGTVSILPPGWKVQTAQSPNATGTVEYIKIGLQAISVAYGVQYSQISGDLEKVSFSSQKAGRLEFFRRISCAQSHAIKPQLSKMMRHLAICYELNTGRKVAAKSIGFTFPGRESVEPLKDAQADVLNVESGFDTLFEVVRRSGRDPEDHISELEREVKAFRDRGLLHPFDPLRDGKSSAIVADADDDDDDDDGDDDGDGAGE